jgi:hypothetical protein
MDPDMEPLQACQGLVAPFEIGELECVRKRGAGDADERNPE